MSIKSDRVPWSPKMVLKSGPETRRQKSGPYYSFFFFVYGFWHRFRFPELGPLMSFKNEAAQVPLAVLQLHGNRY